MAADPQKQLEEYERMWHEALRFVCAEQGADYYYFEGSLLRRSNIRPDQVILDGYPEGWRAHYAARRYAKIDPAIAHARVHQAPYIWPDGAPNTVLTAEQQAMYDDARSYGIESGISFTYRGVAAQYGVLHMASKQPFRGSNLARAATQYEFYMLGAMLMDSHLELHGKDIQALKKSLTRREIECLRWVSEGKTSEEVADILGISKRTVIFHLQNAMEKMGTHSRTSAAVKYALYAIELWQGDDEG